MNFISIANPVESELIIQKSRFLCYCFPIQSEEDFQNNYHKIKKDHPKANHHCFAYILEDDSSIQRMSDNGEPSGTAGLPMLEVLKHKQLTYVATVVVRYFGGIKLGTGGLIRAYSNAVSECISQAKLIQNINHCLFEIELDYKHHDLFQIHLKDSQPQPHLLATNFTEKVNYQLSLAEEDFEPFIQATIDRFQGQVIYNTKGIQAINIPYKE